MIFENKMTKNNNYLPKIFAIITGSMLLLALADWQYSYYEVLRVVVCAASVYLAYVLYEYKQIGWVCVFLAIAVLFNPIIPIYLQKSNWQLFDIIAAVIFFVSLSAMKEGLSDEK